MKKLFAVILSLSLIIAPVPVVHASEGGGWAKQILGLANGSIGATIMAKCQLASMQFSLMAYMAGSITYIAAEIAGGNDQKKKQTKQADTLNNVKATMEEGGDYQKAAIQAQIDDEKTTLSHIQKRRKWYLAVKAMYAVATALAVLELIWSKLPPPAYKPDLGACKANNAANKTISKALSAAYAGLNGYAGGGFFGDGVKGAVVSAGLNLAKDPIQKFIFGVTTTTEAQEYASIPLLNTAKGRIGFFGAATVLVQVIDSGLAKEEKNSKKKIADLEKMLNDFNQATNPTTEIAEGGTPGGSNGGNTSGSTGGATGSLQTGGPGQTYAITELPDGVELPRQCLSTTGEYSSAGCKKPYQFTRPKFNADLKLPTLIAGANTATDIGQAIANGDMAKADVAAGNLNAMAGNLDAIKDKLLKEANDKLVAEGQKPIDINSELQRQVDVMNSALNKQSAGSGNNTLASLGLDAKAGEATTSASDLALENAKANANTTNVPSPEVMPLPDAGLSGLNEDGLAGSGSNSDLDQMLTDRTGKLAALEKMEKGNGEGEIKQDTGTSLFEQVSNRYFLNYSKIFERKKIIPPAAPTAAPANQ